MARYSTTEMYKKRIYLAFPKNLELAGKLVGLGKNKRRHFRGSKLIERNAARLTTRISTSWRWTTHLRPSSLEY